MIYFTSDTHFSHKNCVVYTRKQFRNFYEMDERLVENWNSIVTKNDTVYHLGDFALCDISRLQDIVYSLNGRINLVPGNHDRAGMYERFKGKVTILPSLYELDSKYTETGGLIVLCHYPMVSWNRSHYGTSHLYGHHHGTMKTSNYVKSFDCGMDTHNLYPYSMDEVLKILGSKNPKLVTRRK